MLKKVSVFMVNILQNRFVGVEITGFSWHSPHARRFCSTASRTTHTSRRHLGAGRASVITGAYSQSLSCQPQSNAFRSFDPVH